MRRKIGSLALLFFLSACAQSLDDQQAKFDRFAKSNRFGSSADMWLVRTGMFGSERVALIYAFSPDSQFCAEVAQLYMQKYPDGAGYTCEAAN